MVQEALLGSAEDLSGLVSVGWSRCQSCRGKIHTRTDRNVRQPCQKCGGEGDTSELIAMQRQPEELLLTYVPRVGEDSPDVAEIRKLVDVSNERVTSISDQLEQSNSTIDAINERLNQRDEENERLRSQLCEFETANPPADAPASETTGDE